MFHRWGAVKGVSAELLTALAEPFRAVVRDERAPKNYPFTSPRDLRRQTVGDNEETFRRRVLRCRRQIEKLAQDAGAPPLPTDAVIENHPWHGYRLNPDRVRIVALSDLRPSE